MQQQHQFQNQHKDQLQRQVEQTSSFEYNEDSVDKDKDKSQEDMMNSVEKDQIKIKNSDSQSFQYVDSQNSMPQNSQNSQNSMPQIKDSKQTSSIHNSESNQTSQKIIVLHPEQNQDYELKLKRIFKQTQIEQQKKQLKDKENQYIIDLILTAKISVTLLIDKIKNCQIVSFQKLLLRSLQRNALFIFKNLNLKHCYKLKMIDNIKILYSKCGHDNNIENLQKEMKKINQIQIFSFIDRLQKQILKVQNKMKQILSYTQIFYVAYTNIQKINKNHQVSCKDFVQFVIQFPKNFEVYFGSKMNVILCEENCQKIQKFRLPVIEQLTLTNQFKERIQKVLKQYWPFKQMSQQIQEMFSNFDQISRIQNRSYQSFTEQDTVIISILRYCSQAMQKIQNSSLKFGSFILYFARFLNFTQKSIQKLKNVKAYKTSRSIYEIIATFLIITLFWLFLILGFKTFWETIIFNNLNTTQIRTVYLLFSLFIVFIRLFGLLKIAFAVSILLFMVRIFDIMYNFQWLGIRVER